MEVGQILRPFAVAMGNFGTSHLWLIWSLKDGMAQDTARVNFETFVNPLLKSGFPAPRPRTKNEQHPQKKECIPKLTKQLQPGGTNNNITAFRTVPSAFPPVWGNEKEDKNCYGFPTKKYTDPLA